MPPRMVWAALGSAAGLVIAALLYATHPLPSGAASGTDLAISVGAILLGTLCLLGLLLTGMTLVLNAISGRSGGGRE
ncbi:MAG: hypothetical protein QXG65_06065 [Thermoplasmata archaeon]